MTGSASTSYARRIKMISTLNSDKIRTSVTLMNNDAMVDVLLRLPLKTLLRFKCVCKWWKQLISDPIFVRNYIRQNPQYKVSGIFLQKFLFCQLYSDLEFIALDGQVDADASKPSLSFIEDENGVHIQHSCNGLLLCGSFRCHEEERKYYICKPTTKQSVPLPKPECKTVFGINIAYDPSRSSHYRVVCICDSNMSANHRQIKIYSSNTGLWTTSGNPFVILEDVIFNRGVYWNGSLHWVGRGELSLRFDVEKENMHIMPMPPIEEGWTERKLGYFGESGGHLYLIEIYGAQTSKFDVLELQRDHRSWFVKYHVNLEGVVERGHHPQVEWDVGIVHNYKFSVVHIVQGQLGTEEEESLVVVHKRNGRCGFNLYNLKNKEFMGALNMSPQLGHLGHWYTWEGVYPYTNTHHCYL